MSDNTELFDKNGKALTMTEVMSMLPPLTLLEKVNRVEMIDKHGRNYVNWKSANKVEISLQDDCRTLKIFISEKIKYPDPPIP